MELESERVELRFDGGSLEKIDAWRAKQQDMPSRSEAIRRLVEVGLGRATMSDAERLILIMLRDLYAATKADGEIDPDFVAETIWGGHFWGLDWKYPGLLHGHVNSMAEVSKVVDILEMWDFLEDGFSKLTAQEKDQLKREAAPFGGHVQFEGFDGNHETNRLSIARFLIEKLGRFSRFKGRELNSHWPTVEA